MAKTEDAVLYLDSTLSINVSGLNKIYCIKLFSFYFFGKDFQTLMLEERLDLALKAKV